MELSSVSLSSCLVWLFGARDTDPQEGDGPPAALSLPSSEITHAEGNTGLLSEQHGAARPTPPVPSLGLPTGVHGDQDHSIALSIHLDLLPTRLPITPLYKNLFRGEIRRPDNWLVELS